MSDQITVDVDEVAVQVNAPHVAVDVSMDVHPVDVKIAEAAVAVNVTGAQGPKGGTGPQGDQGVQGERGDPGSAFVHIHYQSVLSSVWTIQHNMGKHPNVVTEDGGGAQIYGTVNYVDDNLLTVTFQFTATGRANCS